MTTKEFTEIELQEIEDCYYELGEEETCKIYNLTRQELYAIL